MRKVQEGEKRGRAGLRLRKVLSSDDNEAPYRLAGALS
jgi:hypothetical protein